MYYVFVGMHPVISIGQPTIITSCKKQNNGSSRKNKQETERRGALRAACRVHDHNTTTVASRGGQRGTPTNIVKEEDIIFVVTATG